MRITNSQKETLETIKSLCNRRGEFSLERLIEVTGKTNQNLNLILMRLMAKGVVENTGWGAYRFIKKNYN